MDQGKAEEFAERLLTTTRFVLTREYLRRAGFKSIETHQPPHDIRNNWYVVRK